MYKAPNKFLNFLTKNSSYLLFSFIILYIIFFSIICLLKYNNFLYNALDLSIINNVFYNTLHGNGLYSSIQGHSYLGDHFTPVIFLLLPLYALYQSPVTLLVLQTIFLALASLPLYKICQIILKNKILPLLISLLWLLSPLVHNINLFEFHFLSILPLFFFSFLYFYLKIKENPHNKKLFVYFFIFLVLSLLIREDVSFIFMAFGIILIFDFWKKRKRYQIFIIAYWLTAISYFILATKTISLYSPSNFSPFLYYYSWLGDTSTQIIKNFFLKFDMILNHISTIGNFEMVIGLLLPFLLLPIIKPKYLLLCLLPFSQIILTSAGGGALTWQTHYAAFFLPGLTISFVFAFKKLNKITNQQLGSKYLLISLLIIANIFLIFSIGPLTGINNLYEKDNSKIQKILKSIPKNTPIASGYNTLPHLSSRQYIYSLNYLFLGHGQFATTKYITQKNPQYIIIDSNDLIHYDIQLAHLTWSKPHYAQGYERLRNLLTDYGIISSAENITLFKKNHPSKTKLYSVQTPPTVTQSKYNFNALKLIDYKITINPTTVSLSFQIDEPTDNIYYAKIKTNNQSKIFPLAYFYPIKDWHNDEIVTVNYPLDIKIDLNTEIYLSLVAIQGGIEIDNLRNIKLVIDKETNITDQSINLTH